LIEVAAGIFEKQGLVFAARRKAGKHLAGYWEFPGGKIEQNETPAECLCRELEEEFEVSVEVGDFVGSSVYDYGEKVIRLLAYKVAHLSGEFTLHDHDEFCWLPLHRLSELRWAPADVPLVEKYVALSSTASYYSSNAQDYINETLNLEMKEAFELFIPEMTPCGNVLDIGCGSGRDSLYFIEQGFMVTPIDGCPEMSRLASSVIGQPVESKQFQSISDIDKYNGIWANASLLHCPKSEIKHVFQKLIAALKLGGVWFMSFKVGEGEQFDDRGRFFNNYSEQSLKTLIGSFDELVLQSIWLSKSERPNGAQEWINAIVCKREITK